LIGTTLSHFEITAELGAGGMGTVYRGKDTKLGREVAIKVLPELFTAAAERLARFEREAKAKGLMPLDDALSIARQISEALEAAHKSGVIHRDLKPANIKLTPDGRVKVLDFGLAKALDSGAGGAAQGDLSLSPTLTAQMTSAGMILGTAAYMSPEQAKGEEADKRSDIWSFGVVLWEMLVGQKTFAQKTVSETLAAVLMSNPDHSVMPGTVPLSIRRLIERCLQKDPAQRLHDIADARLEIEAVLRGDDSAAVLADPIAESPSRAGFWKVLAAVTSVAAIVALGSHFLPSDAPNDKAQSPIRFAIDRPPLLVHGLGPAIAISPDGSQVAYGAINQDGIEQIFLRRLDAVEATPIAGTETGFAPFFSPDGSRIGFSTFFSINSVALHGGAAQQLIEIQGFRGGTWADDDSIWYGPDTETGLWRMDSDGKNATRMTQPDADQGERSHRWPAVLPGSDVVLFTVATAEITSFDQARIDALRVSTGERKTVVDSGTFPLFVEPGVLLYVFSGKLMAANFDAATLSLVGQPTPVIDRVKWDPVSGIVAAAVSPDGSIAVGHGQPFANQRKLVVYDPDGTSQPLTNEVKPYQGLALSPDGSTLALDVDGANASIWLLDLDRNIQTRLTSRGNHMAPVWSPDGSEIATSSSSGGTYQVFRHHLAAGESSLLYESLEVQSLTSSWSPEGRLASSAIPAGEGLDIWVQPTDGTGQGGFLLQSPYAEFFPKFSPDGRWLAFVSDESGQPEIYILPSNGVGAKTRVSSNGGSFPIWSPSSDRVLFHNGTVVWSAAIVGEDRPRVGRPEAAFEVGPIFLDGASAMTMTPDGRLITIETVDDPEETAADLIFTRHWVDELASILRGSG
jgi:serine/threonine-protein kinase